MLEPPYRALSTLLRVFSLLAALGGLLLIIADKPLILRILLRPPEGEVSALFLSMLKEVGGMVLLLGILLWFASRNPVRNVAVVDALIAGLCVLALTPLLSPVDDGHSQYLSGIQWPGCSIGCGHGMCIGNLWEISEESFGGGEGRGPA